MGLLSKSLSFIFQKSLWWDLDDSFKIKVEVTFSRLRWFCNMGGAFLAHDNSLWLKFYFLKIRRNFLWSKRNFKISSGFFDRYHTFWSSRSTFPRFWAHIFSIRRLFHFRQPLNFSSTHFLSRSIAPSLSKSSFIF